MIEMIPESQWYKTAYGNGLLKCLLAGGSQMGNLSGSFLSSKNEALNGVIKLRAEVVVDSFVILGGFLKLPERFRVKMKSHRLADFLTRDKASSNGIPFTLPERKSSTRRVISASQY